MKKISARPLAMVLLVLAWRISASAQCTAQVTVTQDPQTATARAVGTVQGGNCGTCAGMEFLGSNIGNGCSGSPNIIDVTRSTECRAPGSYSVAAGGTCRSTDASGSCSIEQYAQATTSFAIPQSRVTELDVAISTISPGLKRIDFNYVLQNLATPRGITWEYRPVGGAAPTAFHDSIPSPAGTYTTEVDTECWGPGVYEVVVRIGECGSAARETVQAFEVEGPSINIEVRRDATGQQSAVVTYNFPNIRTAAKRRLRVEWVATPEDGGGVLIDQEAPGQSGTLPPIALPSQQSERMLRATATSCGTTSVVDYAKVEPCCCEEPACEVGRPIRLWDGAVTYSARTRCQHPV